MSSLAEIESAAKQLPPAEQRKLVRSLTANLRSAFLRKNRATGKPVGSDYLLAAPAGAPVMTPELVKQLLDQTRHLGYGARFKIMGCRNC